MTSHRPSSRSPYSIRPIAAIVVVLLTFSAGPLVLAQQGGAETEQPAYQPMTAAVPDIQTSDLKVMLRPLRKSALEGELNAWMDLLEAKASAIRDAELGSFKAIEEAETVADAGQEESAEVHEEQSAALAEQAVELRAERAALVERVNIVIAALKAKGGDPAEAELYVKEVSALPPTPTGFKALMNMSKAWIVSPEGGLKFGKRIGMFALCIVAAWIVGSVLSKILDKALQRFGKTSELLRSFLVKTVRRVLLIIGFVIGISYLGINITPLIAAIGAAGLVIGLALQGTLSNFASGLMILAYRPFDVGDVVTAGGVTGKVDSMTLVSTVFKTPDNQLVIVPNSKIWDDVITNVTASSERRVDLTFGIGYGDDVDRARTILEAVVAEHPKVLKDPAPVIKVHELGASSVNFVVRPWTKTEDYWDVYWDLHESVKKRFEAEGISIPFPQQDIHIHQVPAKA